MDKPIEISLDPGSSPSKCRVFSPVGWCHLWPAGRASGGNKNNKTMLFCRGKIRETTSLEGGSWIIMKCKQSSRSGIIDHEWPWMTMMEMMIWIIWSHQPCRLRDACSLILAENLGEFPSGPRPNFAECTWRNDSSICLSMAGINLIYI